MHHIPPRISRALQLELEAIAAVCQSNAHALWQARPSEEPLDIEQMRYDLGAAIASLGWCLQLLRDVQELEQSE